ncbi:MAG: protein kinase [Acidobacteriota bacterium]
MSDETPPSAREGDEAAETRRKVGPYRLGPKLGAGGMGEVFRGYDERLERPVALKNVRADRQGTPSARRRLLREARAMARVHHPAIAQIHDWVEAEDGDWFVMELVAGSTLRHILSSQTRLTWRSAAGLAAEIADGLFAAHGAGLVHRDLKPANIMVTAAGRAKILDFGLAKRHAAVEPEEDEDMSLTGAGQVIGTVTAMSPEQALGLPIDSRTDLFALGIVLYESITGVSPFRAETAVQTLARICNRAPEPISSLVEGVPDALIDLIDSLLAKEPEQRPESAQEVALRLRRLLGERSAREPTSELTSASSAARAAASRPLHPQSQSYTRSELSSTSRRSSERRLMTVVILELTAEPGADPEVLFEAMPDFQAAAAELVVAHEGHLESRTGHRVVACFGHPIAGAGDAERAVELAAAAVYGAPLEDAGLEGATVRAAVHTGHVLVLVEGERQMLVLGRTLERAQALLPAEGVAASAETERLTRGRFTWRPEEVPSSPHRAEESGPSFRLEDPAASAG